jgi:hypothetical protein
MGMCCGLGRTRRRISRRPNPADNWRADSGRLRRERSVFSVVCHEQLAGEQGSGAGPERGPDSLLTSCPASYANQELCGTAFHVIGSAEEERLRADNRYGTF